MRRQSGGMVTDSVPVVDLAQVCRERLLDDGLHVYMQPVVDLRTGVVHLFEALARLELADGTLLLPHDFLPLLDEADVALLFRRCLDAVGTQLADWDAVGIRVVSSVNLTPSTLRDRECASWVEGALRQHGIAPDRLGLELTECGVVDDAVQLGVLGELRALGVGLMMDDLGSGYSTLKRLTKLHFDTVKIDRELVAQLRSAPTRALGMLSALIQLGRDLESDIVVEGLEDDALVEAVTLLGAPYGQGYALARPMPMHAVPEWLGRDPVRSDRAVIRTFLGALAYHWKLHRAGSTHPGTVGACPITPLLAAEDLAGTSVLGWHQQQHRASFERGSSDDLVQWLAARSTPPPSS